METGFKSDLVLGDEAATRRLGAELAMFVKTGDVVALSGDLGAGKTTLARAVIRALAPDAGDFEVPSPTFTLVQPYDFTRVAISHFDLYRITRADEIFELGFDDALKAGAVLIEWPERMAEFLPPDRLDIALAHGEDTASRQATMTGHGSWAVRLERMTAIADFIQASDWRDAERCHLQGDASTRRYERLEMAGGKRAVLMDMPARSDASKGPGGKSYSALVHLADDIAPVIAMTGGLRRLGLAAPEIYHCDMERGLAVIEDFGDAVLGTLEPDGPEIEPAYRVACDILVHLANSDCPASLALPDGSAHLVPPYDRDALQFEAGLVLDWFWPECKSGSADPDARRAFEDILDRCLARVKTRHPVWVLRDYHSPNLIWRPDGAGLGRIGLIDYQDAVLGDPAYDLVSLLQDARIEVAADREQHYLDYYLQQRAKADSAFDARRFRAAYAILGAQRCSKILGIFARLNRRDRKPDYLKHIPRVSDYLERNLRHAELAELKAWYDQRLPAALRVASVTGNP